jgi:hypothetical protein
MIIKSNFKDFLFSLYTTKLNKGQSKTCTAIITKKAGNMPVASSKGGGYHCTCIRVAIAAARSSDNRKYTNEYLVRFSIFV